MREELDSRMRSKPVRITALILGIALLLVAAASSLAQAEPRQLLVTLLGGKQVPVTVDAAPGSPAGSIPLPDLGGPVVSVAEIGSASRCSRRPRAPATTAAPTTAATTGTTVTGPPTTIAPDDRHHARPRPARRHRRDRQAEGST